MLNGATIWQRYSMLNTMCKTYLGFYLQKKFPQLKPQIQLYDSKSAVKKQATTFSFEELNKFWKFYFTGSDTKLLNAQVCFT